MASTDVAVVLHSSLPEGAAKDDLDGLCQADAVFSALGRMGYDVLKLPFSLDGGLLNADAVKRLGESRLAEELRAARPRLIFNLVETVDSSGKWCYLAPALAARLGVSCTGSPAGALFLTTHKIATKIMLRRLGISTPSWVSAARQDQFCTDDTYIIKALYEDASVGMGQSSVVRFDDAAMVAPHLNRIMQETGKEHFAEKYIDGREFSIALLGEGGRAEILAPAEMHFRGFDERNKHRIVDYNAKWETESFEYQNTFAVHRFPPEDGTLLSEMRAIAGACWTHFKLSGYARIDFRVDRAGKPWVLEINANPCITPDESGFLNAAGESGLSFDGVVRRIVAEALDEGDAQAYLDRSGVI